ncbi:MAG: glycerol acyltransferase [Hoylesella marshii]|uniref:glycerol acyltransferase n=1 Tax=Hoylesella marshii TaxID=189722 RepID=UPI003FA053EC
MGEGIEKTINIEEILHRKMGGKVRWVPSPLIAWLKRIVHEDEVNAFLNESRNLTGVDWLEACVHYLGMTLDVRGKGNLPPKGDGCLYTFVSNHPLGGVDGVALGFLIGRHYDGHFRYLVNDLLMNLPGLAPLCIPINTTGSKSRNFPSVVEAGFADNHHILMFPAGLCSRKIGREIRDLPWKKTFITKSIETHRDVVPIRFSGRNSAFFYRLANICKALGIKFNIAMLFLVDEMYKNRNQTFSVSIGKPIPWQTFDKSKTPAEWAAYVQKRVYEL